MHTVDEERYVSLRMAHSDLEYALKVLKTSERSQEGMTKAALFHFAIICFFRPFKTSHGIHQRRFKSIKKSEVCPAHEELFDMLESERDGRIAHKDIACHSPQLHYWTTQELFSIVFRSSAVDWKDSDLKAKFKRMIVDSISGVERQMQVLEQKFKKEMSSKSGKGEET